MSSWLLADSIGPATIVNPEALLHAGFTSDGVNPDPTTVLIGWGTTNIGQFWGDCASALFCTSLFAALLAFHNAVARYFFALGREGVLPRAFGRTQPRTGAPYIGSLAQSMLALVVVGTFVIAGGDPVLKLFTWFTNLGALGVLLLMTITSFSVVAFFRARPGLETSAWRTTIAPLASGIALAVALVLGVANFNVLITSSTTAPTDTMAIVLPAVLFGSAALGVIVAMVIKRRRPDVYAEIGEPSPVEPELGVAQPATD